MKKTISIIVIVAMLLSSILAIIPMSAAEENTGVSYEDKLVYTFNFKGDDKFKPAILEGEAMTYVVAEDGSSVTVKGDGTTGNETVNMWGGTVAGVKATLGDVYSFTYKVKANTDLVTSDKTAQNNSVGVGAWLAPQGENAHASSTTTTLTTTPLTAKQFLCAAVLLQ
jgi:hypothetical protein